MVSVCVCLAEYNTFLRFGKYDPSSFVLLLIGKQLATCMILFSHPLRSAELGGPGWL